MTTILVEVAMSADYWAAFRRNAREILQARAPHGWRVVNIEVYPGRVVATVSWDDDHQMTFDTHAPDENAALQDIAESLDKLDRQTWGIKE